MSLIAAYWDLSTEGRMGSSGVRSFDGARWQDITFNLSTVTGFSSGTIVKDLMFINGVLWAIVSDWFNDETAILAFAGDRWVIRQQNKPEADKAVIGATFSGFMCIKGQTFVHGEAVNWEIDTSMAEGGWWSYSFGLWRVQGNFAIPFAQDHGGLTEMSYARRTAVDYDPVADRLVIGNLSHDSWAYYDFKTRNFGFSSDYGGSCVFCIVRDKQGVWWSGDFAELWYRSVDRGLSWHRSESDREHGLGEPWEYLRWGNDLIAVGCAPCSVARRTSADGFTATLGECWETIGLLETDRFAQGVGFMAAEPIGDTLFLGFGGEPWYYARTEPGKVYAFRGGTFTDISGNLNWGSGAHIVISQARACSGGVLNGRHVNQGVRLDASTDPRPRMSPTRVR